MVRIYTDGGARGNPGPSAIGIVVCDADDIIIKPFSEYIGRATNNQAEYKALIRGLEIAANYTDGDVVCTLDSELVVRQMSGEYRVKNPEMAALADDVRRRTRKFRSVVFHHNRRMTGHLAIADRLVNDALDDAQRSPIDAVLKTSITKRVEIGPRPESGWEIVDPLYVGNAFLEHCLRRGWIVRRGTGTSERYFISETGKKELGRFGIEL